MTGRRTEWEEIMALEVTRDARPDLEIVDTFQKM